MSYTITRAQPMYTRRGGVTLAPTLEAHLASGKWAQKGPLQPHWTRLPPMPNTSKPRFGDFNLRSLTLTAKPEVTPNPPRADNPRLQEMTPALWVAYSNSLPLPPPSKPEGGFTHVVEIAYPVPAARRKTNAFHLPLILPHASSRNQGGRLSLALTTAQLHSAIIFVLKALPPAFSDGASRVRVLVMAPPGRTADAMSVVGGYLAMAAGRALDEVLKCKCIDEDQEMECLWKSEVRGQEIEQIERVVGPSKD